MPTSRRRPTGPADTTDPDARVTSSTPAPTDRDLRRGTTAAVTALPELAVPPLVLVDEPRVETYEIEAPGGVIVEVTRDLDSGQMSYAWTDRTARTEFTAPDGAA